MTVTIYQAPEGFLRDLERELVFLGVDILGQKENLVLTSGDAVESAWAAMIWKNVRELTISSIGDGVKQLRQIGKDWVSVPGAYHRRAHLISEQLSSPRPRAYAFTETFSAKPFGQFVLWEENIIYSSTELSSPFPNGEIQFEEDKNAPSRAYLKLWEALFRIGEHPHAGDKCVDLGACPGGWTYVLAGLGAEVTAIDRSELEKNLMKKKNVKFVKGDAFSFSPEKAGKVDWLFSDLICYPEKLFEFLQPWFAKETAKHVVCTLKFQGESDPAIVEKFKKIPGAKVLHLHHNKHELTFFWSASGA